MPESESSVLPGRALHCPQAPSLQVTAWRNPAHITTPPATPRAGAHVPYYISFPGRADRGSPPFLPPFCPPLLLTDRRFKDPPPQDESWDHFSFPPLTPQAPGAWDENPACVCPCQGLSTYSYLTRLSGWLLGGPQISESQAPASPRVGCAPVRRQVTEGQPCSSRRCHHDHGDILMSPRPITM